MNTFPTQRWLLNRLHFLRGLSATIAIVTEGGWDAETVTPTAPRAQDTPAAAVPQAQLPESLQKPYAVLTAMKRLMAKNTIGDYDQAFVRESLEAIEAWQGRNAVEHPGFFRPMTAVKRTAILKFYENAALGMYNGLARRMDAYAQSSDPAKKRSADLFRQARDFEKPNP